MLMGRMAWIWATATGRREYCRQRDGLLKAAAMALVYVKMVENPKQYIMQKSVENPQQSKLPIQIQKTKTNPTVPFQR
ncbi:hypothetical protein V6N13_120759 [Hibiscus sabdariffa]|uniref:Uncharacterized protein n=1 Tax=Hibiscus sabdariffa TaxID=183260 RepID=A0ABR2E6R5_9ROSI